MLAWFVGVAWLNMASGVRLSSDALGIAVECPDSYCSTNEQLEPNKAFKIAGMSGYVVRLSPGVSLGDAYLQEQESLGRLFSLSYKRIKKEFAVLSGMNSAGTRVVYEKLVRARPGIVGLRVEYDASRKAELDSVVAKIMGSWRSIAGEGVISENQAVSLVERLPEVGKIDKEIQRVKGHLIVQVDKRPSLNSGSGTLDACYEVFVGGNLSERIELRMLAYVDGFTREIYVLHAVCDKVLPLSKWREMRRNPPGDCEEMDGIALK